MNRCPAVLIPPSSNSYLVFTDGGEAGGEGRTVHLRNSMCFLHYLFTRCVRLIIFSISCMHCGLSQLRSLGKAAKWKCNACMQDLKNILFLWSCLWERLLFWLYFWKAYYNRFQDLAWLLPKKTLKNNANLALCSTLVAGMTLFLIFWNAILCQDLGCRYENLGMLFPKIHF